MEIVVELQPGVWLRESDGVPGRVLFKENATVYPSRKAAMLALIDARKYRPFREAELQVAEAEEGE